MHTWKQENTTCIEVKSIEIWKLIQSGTDVRIHTAIKKVITISC